MSIEVELGDLPAAVWERGAAAYLVTSGATRPRVVSVTVRVVDGDLVVGAGRRTAANVAERPEVTVFWPASTEDPEHSLLVDGTATVDPEGDTIAVTPSSAILHRARTEGVDGPC